MLIAETMLALDIICTMPGKKVCDPDHCYIIDDTSPSRSFQISSGPSMEKVLISKFQSINGVSDVRVRNDRNRFYLEIDLSVFDRPTRNRVFDEEMEIYVEFPDTNFEFCVVDVSTKATQDADAA